MKRLLQGTLAVAAVGFAALVLASPAAGGGQWRSLRLVGGGIDPTEMVGQITEIKALVPTP